MDSLRKACLFCICCYVAFGDVSFAKKPKSKESNSHTIGICESLSEVSCQSCANINAQNTDILGFTLKYDNEKCQQSQQNNVSSLSTKSDKHAFLLIYDNDSNFNSKVDKYYTAGVSLKFHSKDLAQESNKKFYKFMNAISLPSFFVKYLPKIHDETILLPSFAIALAQEMYAPKDRFSNPPPANDHPYSGALYLSATVQNRFKYILEQFEAQVGVVGKASLAKQTQDFIHDISGNARLKGWEAQLKNEPLFNVYYRLSFSIPQVYEKSKHIVDIMPQASFGLGNAKIHAQANLLMRVGYNLSPNVLSPHINSGFVSGNMQHYGFSVQAFMGAGIRAVVRNMFLQGNSFAPRKDIDLHRAVGEFICGLSLNYKRFFIAYTAIARTKEFISQQDTNFLGIHTYGSIIVGGNF